MVVSPKSTLQVCSPTGSPISSSNTLTPSFYMIRSYYPNFVIQKTDGSYMIIEVKGDNMIDDPVVLAKKEFAEQMASASRMTYSIIKGTDATNGNYSILYPVTSCHRDKKFYRTTKSKHSRGFLWNSQAEQPIR